MTIEKKLREEGRKEGKEKTYDILVQITSKFGELNPTTIKKVKKLDKQSKLTEVENVLYDSETSEEFEKKIDSI
ncbi:hypothetical protein [Halarsenatibacter silvermanii]|uniref:DUF4351 domain-containing protein n=1 Tax=Halarsenatibacter silvermanii TaxID=321763 RepID=A0A1G9M4Q9_9FIRM|nr:hypothetical protein [Halarsenatibacter silvermanii]SDL69144.1 hypothetical protein SAMN04488692_107105 [Halarsenatibacter silvermanii]